MLQPGSDGDPVPSGTLIFRVGRDVHASEAALERRVPLPGLFELSETDKNAPIPRLSVWVEELSVADQAWDFMGSRPKNTLVACLTVDAVRSINTPEGFAAPDVEWEKALLPDGSPNERPGAQGHCGISNLNQGGNGKQDGAKAKRKLIRMKLADAARLSRVPVPHRFDDQHLRVAAFYISTKPEHRSDSCEGHWISAIRQMRRAHAHATPGDASQTSSADSSAAR
jgi:hypothetical protein